MKSNLFNNSVVFYDIHKNNVICRSHSPWVEYGELLGFQSFDCYGDFCVFPFNKFNTSVYILKKTKKKKQQIT